MYKKIKRLKESKTFKKVLQYSKIQNIKLLFVTANHNLILLENNIETN